jgi:hypothetical protein
MKWRRKPAVRLRNIQWVSWWRRSLGMKLITCLHLMSRLRMSGAKSPLPSLPFTSFTGTTLPLPYRHHEVRRIVAATKLKMGSRCGMLLCPTGWVQGGGSSITLPSFCCCWKQYTPAASDWRGYKAASTAFVPMLSWIWNCCGTFLSSETRGQVFWSFFVLYVWSRIGTVWWTWSERRRPTMVRCMSKYVLSCHLLGMTD